MPSRLPVLRILVAAAISIVAHQAFAQSSEFVQINVLLDLDNEIGTGCQQQTIDGVFEGVDQRVEIRLQPDYTPFPPGGVEPPVEISRVDLLNCTQNGTTIFGNPTSVPGAGTRVGEANGVDGTSVIEVAVPTMAQAPEVRVGAQIGLADEIFTLASPPGLHDALLTTDGATGSAAILIAGTEAEAVPTLGILPTAMLAALVLSFLAFTQVRRGPGTTSSFVLIVVLSGIAVTALWATSMIIPDGQTDDWKSVPDATDPLTFQGVKAPDLIALFGTINDDGSLTLRIDALLPESCAGEAGGYIFCVHVRSCDALPDGCDLTTENAVRARGLDPFAFNCIDNNPAFLPRCQWVVAQPGFFLALVDNREERSCTTLNDGTRVIGTYTGDLADVDISASDAYCTQQFQTWETQGCPLLFSSLQGDPIDESLCGRAIRGTVPRDFSCKPTGKCVIASNYCENSDDRADETCCNNAGGVCNNGCGNFAGCRTIFSGDPSDGFQLNDFSCSSSGTAAESLCESL